MSERIAVMNAGQVEQVGSPQQLYEAPGSAFVRDFLGKTLLLEGYLEDIGPDEVTVALDGITTHLHAPQGEEIARAPIGSRACVAVRPEDIQVRRATNDILGRNCLLGAVEAALFVGDHYECRVRVGTQALLITTPRSLHLDPGDDLQLSFSGGLSVWPLQP